MNLRSILFLSALAIVGAAHAQAVPGGSLVLLRDGDGTTALSSTATPIFFDNYTTGGALIKSFAVPSTGTGAITQSGSATSEGFLNLSGNQVSFVGYNAAAGTTSVVSTTAASTPRAIGAFNTTTGLISTVATINNQFSANNIRSAVVNGTTYLASGANTSPNGGIVSGNAGDSTGTNTATSTTNARVLASFGGNSYFSTGSTANGTSLGIYQYTPGTTGNQTLVAATGTGTSPYGFQFLTTTSLLVADDSGTGSFKLFTNSGSGFSLSQTYTLPSSTGQSRSFVVLGSTLYFTTATGLFSSALPSSSTTLAPSTLATAGTNQAFRGLVYVPSVQATPEPGALAALGVGAVALLRRRRKA